MTRFVAEARFLSDLLAFSQKKLWDYQCESHRAMAGSGRMGIGWLWDCIDEDATSRYFGTERGAT